ncbi:hypothetical protein Pelo_14989 [Pelomyxa schiedti]|nr:hypothetical protein Pelo_14989 [Pelomyxa schiedti]
MRSNLADDDDPEGDREIFDMGVVFGREPLGERLYEFGGQRQVISTICDDHTFQINGQVVWGAAPWMAERLGCLLAGIGNVEPGLGLGGEGEQCLETLRNKAETLQVVELGAGCGLVGIVMAQLGVRTVLTDFDDDVLELLNENVSKNVKTGCASVTQLDWKKPVNAPLSHSFPIAIASDVTYHREFCPSLFRAASALLQLPSPHHTSGGMFLMANGKHRYFPEVCLQAARDAGMSLVAQHDDVLSEVTVSLWKHAP